MFGLYRMDRLYLCEDNCKLLRLDKLWISSIQHVERRSGTRDMIDSLVSLARRSRCHYDCDLPLSPSHRHHVYDVFVLELLAFRSWLHPRRRCSLCLHCCCLHDQLYRLLRHPNSNRSAATRNDRKLDTPATYGGYRKWWSKPAELESDGRLESASFLVKILC